MLDSTDIQLCQAITESLMFLGQCTRHDIIFTVNQLARAMSKPSKLHKAAAKHLLLYLNGDTSRGNHVHYRVPRTDGLLRCELGKQLWQRKVDLRLLVHAG